MFDFLKRKLSRKPPPAAVDQAYTDRLNQELKTFENDLVVHDLPPIFHYWSNEHLLPVLQKFGLTDPEQFFFKHTAQKADSARSLRIVSLGSGNCDMEARLAQKLSQHGVSDFVIDCMDINDDMLERGKEHARVLEVADHIRPLKADFNCWKSQRQYDVIIANQSLHHVTELESLFAEVRNALASGATFLISDMIGRNGHMRWPEALAGMAPFWDELPEPYRYNKVLKRQENEFMDHDCSTEGFEGIRAQDILPLLVKNFEFELFLPFANIVAPFIDRCFGHNFDAQAAWDRDFIDRVHRQDQAGLLQGLWKPTQVIAAVGCENYATQLVDARLSPEFCIRPTS